MAFAGSAIDGPEVNCGGMTSGSASRISFPATVTPFSSTIRSPASSVTSPDGVTSKFGPAETVWQALKSSLVAIAWSTRSSQGAQAEHTPAGAGEA